jgi:transposase
MPRIASKSHHSPHKRTKVVHQFLSGVSARAIAAKFDLTRSAVYNIHYRYKQQQSAKSRPRSGRPHSLNERDKRHLFRLIEIDPFIQNSELLRRAGLSCCTATLTSFLKKEGIQHTKALRRPKLTPAVAEKRLQFARLHIRKPLSWWKRVIFSDETTVARGQGERQKWVFCPIVGQLQP